VFPGYYKDEEKTREAIDEEGWLHSGDIGVWTASGHLKIVDRKKNMFKLSQGEYVAAEKIENVCLSAWVQQIFVHGDSLHSMLVAIVVPNPDTLKSWARDNGHPDTPLATLCSNPDVKKMVLKDLQARAKAAGLQGFEIPKDIHLDAEPWTPENILTPTFKLKRADAKRLYADHIDRMYEVLDPVAGMKGLKQGVAQ
jgi:long-chain acyl-CoA synthetase